MQKETTWLLLRILTEEALNVARHVQCKGRGNPSMSTSSHMHSLVMEHDAVDKET